MSSIINSSFDINKLQPMSWKHMKKYNGLSKEVLPLLIQTI